jgi:hypothetical protein
MKKIKNIALLLILITALTGCSDTYLDTVPTSSTSTKTIFETTNNAKQAINGIARLMVNQYQDFGQVFCGEGTIKFLFGEYTGENFSRPRLTGWSTVMNSSYLENSNSISYNGYPWFYYYELIGNANSIIANIDGANGTEQERQFIKAQALTYRAYCYTQLVQFYCYRWDDSNNGTAVSKRNNGLVLRTEENMEEINVPLSPSGTIYEQIYKDLDEAIRLYKASGIKRNNIWEPNIDVANAVYARAALYRKDYETAASKAAEARAEYPLMSNAEYTSGFSEPNKEWIWGSYGGDDQTLYYYGFHSYMAYDANTSIIRSYPVCISKELYDKIPDTDIRKTMFLDGKLYSYSNVNGELLKTADANQVRASHQTMTPSHGISAYMSFKFSIKGSIGVGYINHFRSAEMYLIEAEAKHYLHDDEGAQAAMNALIKNSGRNASYTCTATGEALKSEIKMYRAIELWGEGFDWPDKKRYNEKLVRRDFNNGGNFAEAMAITLEPNFANGWTYFTPYREFNYNHALN